MNLCVCGHSEKDHSRFTCDCEGCDCYNFNPAAGVTVQPNDCGVYPEESAERIDFAIGKPGKRADASCEIQVGEEWLYSSDCQFTLGDFSGSSGPLSRDREPHRTREDALVHALDRAMRHFHTGDRGGCATPKQVEISRKMNGILLQFKAKVGGAVAEIVAALPVGTQLDLFGGAL
jgi:hypothetical protein